MGPPASLYFTIMALVSFCRFCGRIEIARAKTGCRITRFKAIKSFVHLLLPSSFILPGITGLISLFGRKVLMSDVSAYRIDLGV